MPITLPTIDDRKYQALLDDALARIPVHNPEWTNFNQSDPGVTILEVLAFYLESLNYRANLIPERHRRKFLSLLGIPLRPAASAQGIVRIVNERGPLAPLTLFEDLELTAGEVPFRTTLGVDVLPIEAQVFFKREVESPSPALESYYRELYASYDRTAPATKFVLYETVPFKGGDDAELDLSDTVGASLWIALLARSDREVDEARRALRQRVLSLGVVPSLEESERRLAPGVHPGDASETPLVFEMPVGGALPEEEERRKPEYRALRASTRVNVLAEPGVVQVLLPETEAEMSGWSNLDPLEAGTRDFPPEIEDTKLGGRLITWLRVRSPSRAAARFAWLGINAVTVSQRVHVVAESLGKGSGEPDQRLALANAPVLPGSVRVRSAQGTVREEWNEIADLLAAGPEVRVTDPRLPPGTKVPEWGASRVFVLDPEAGALQFGDGARGARPPLGADLTASYDYGVGAAGNLAAGSIKSGPALPAGFKVSQEVRTWGGAAAESEAEGERQITRLLQNRDRLVTEDDFRTIVKRTPGIDLGRAEVLAAWNPALRSNAPGDAPGAVTLMLIPRFDPDQPDAPVPDRLFLDAVCEFLDPRRLVTTEVFLRGPEYRPIWVSIGIEVVAGHSTAEVRERVRQALAAFLSPLPAAPAAPGAAECGASLRDANGWPLWKTVNALELAGEANRQDGVLLVNDCLVTDGANLSDPRQVAISGLQLPRVMAISVAIGDPAPLADVMSPRASDEPGGEVVPVPAIPEEC